MKRTQLYIDEGTWEAVRLQARQTRTSISELVRQAVREKYGLGRRRQALLAWAGVWKDRADLPDSETYVRRLRGGSRLKRTVP